MANLLVAVALWGALAGVASAGAHRATVVASIDDASAGLDAKARAANIEAIERVLATIDAGALRSRHLDVAVAGFTMTSGAERVDITARVRIAISDRHGKLLALVTGTATVEVPRARFRGSQLPSYRREALTAATQSALGRVVRDRSAR
jgi:hypothetical protein